MATTTPLAPPRILATAARILAASSAGGELFLPDGLDASALERLLRALDGWRCDVVGDRLSWMPPANPWSSRLAARVLVHLARVIDDQRLDLDYFGSDAGFVLDPHPAPYGRIVSPDASLVRRARMTPQSTPASGFWPLVPDLAIEVRSPGDGRQPGAPSWRPTRASAAGGCGRLTRGHGRRASRCGAMATRSRRWPRPTTRWSLRTWCRAGACRCASYGRSAMAEPRRSTTGAACAWSRADSGSS